ncbi:MAG: hypothetical protein J6T88_04595 [Bacteroidales bacterium]|nr:hypothetical protein [Bacteroidales bacterium]
MKKLEKILVLIVCMLLTYMPLRSDANRPQRGQQAIYNRYAQRTELTVAQVTGFKLNDSVKVDVVILVADNDKAWREMCEEFDIRNTKGIATWTGDAIHPEKRCSWSGAPCCKVVASPKKRTICIYQLKNEVDYESLMDYQMDLMTK